MKITENKILEILLKSRMKLTAYIRTIVGDFHCAEDVFQDVSMKAIRSSEQFKDIKHLERWLWVVCRNDALIKQREQKKLPVFIDKDILDSIHDEFQKTNLYDLNDTEIKLEKCLGKLTGFSRKLIMLRYRKNLTGQKLAKELNRKVESIYVALSRTHKTLRECMKR